MKHIFTILAIAFAFAATAKEYKITSPDGNTSVTVDINNPAITYIVYYKGQQLTRPSLTALEVISENKTLNNWALEKNSYKAINNTIIPLVKEKNAIVKDVYNETVFAFKNKLSLEFRVYNDGVAYRYTGKIGGKVTVKSETAQFNILPESVLYYAKSTKRDDADIFHTSFESTYTKAVLDTVSDNPYMITPVAVCNNNLPKILITESDVRDYPGIFLVKDGKNLKAVLPSYPSEEKIVGDEFKQKIVTKRTDYLAVTDGTRTFPWRIIAVAPTDADLLTNDIVYRVAKAPDFKDFGWIKPGKSTEEWLTGVNLYGVDFRAGINTETYKYYIDFASMFGFEYVMLDAGWSDTDDLFSITPGMNIEELVNYADKKGVKLILWTLALTMEKQMNEILPWMKKIGVKIVMTDFIDRNDQPTINFMDKFAAECAKLELMCMIHGATPPYGFSRTYPNMLAREGVLGSEYNAWSSKATPDHDLMLPFTRMFTGPMDYEPGILQNSTKEQPEKSGFERVVAQGTRMHQIAMFVVYESPLQLFSGNLSDAFREPDLMTFLGKIPTVWDETLIIHAEFGKSIVEARRLGSKWFLGAINGWETAEFDVPLNFLPARNYKVEEAADGINADRNPHDYKIRSYDVTEKSSIKIKLAPGGGFVARIE